MTVMDGYIRVSDVGGRAGERFQSPEEQRQALEAWARLNGVTLGEVVTELDVSGARAPEERKIERLLRRVEEGSRQASSAIASTA